VRDDARVPDLLEAHTARLHVLDPLLGVDARPPADGELIDVGGARGWARLVDVDPASAVANWGRLRQYGLSVRWAGRPADLDALLVRWVDWTRTAGAATAGADSQGSLTWPSRDLDAARLFVAHGLTPGTTIAVRPHGRAVSTAVSADGVTLRRAGVRDAAAVVELTAEDLRFEGGLSVAGERPGYEDRRRAEATERLSAPEPWAWVAERDGAVIGALTASRPADASWIGGLSAAQPAAYVGLLSVAPAERGGGVGASLVALAQAEFDLAGVAATLLFYGTFNPLSVPFWSRLGWRPLWTAWSAHPASTLR
jgi:predicted N-acetyltransferase YhbS